MTVRTEQSQRRRQRFKGSIALNLQFSGLSGPGRWSSGRGTSPQVVSMGNPIPRERLNEIGSEMALPLKLCSLFLWA